MAIDRRIALRGALLAVAVLATGVAHARMDTAGSTEQGESFIPRPAYAKVSALGFDALLADFYWLQAVQIIGRSRGDVSDHEPTLARLIEVVTALDPWVDHPYRFAAVWLTRDQEMVREANKILARGIAYHPVEWRNRYHLGFNHFFFLEDEERAADVLSTAVHLDGAPRYLGALVGRLRANRGGLETAAAFLAQLVHSASDEYARAEYMKALDEIETERRARRLDTARGEFRRRRGRDLAAVGDLVTGPDPVLRRLPGAHPHFDGFEWTLDEETGSIVSSFYRARYELHVHPSDARRRDRWRAERSARSGQAG